MISDAEALAVIAELAVAERDGTAEKSQITIGPFSTYVLISAIQLAMRHDGVSGGGGPTLGILTQIRDQLLVMFPEGSRVREILALGMDPDRDMPVIDTTSSRPPVSGPILQIPFRVDAETFFLVCPACQSVDWRESGNDYACARCRTVYSRESILARIGSIT